MNFYRVTGLHYSGKLKTFIIKAEDISHARQIFEDWYPNFSIGHIKFLRSEEEKEYECKCQSPSKAKRRGYFKTRLCQIRANLQSMTDSEDGLLTPEELIQLQRITCKVDRVIALFHERTMELKTRGELG